MARNLNSSLFTLHSSFFTFHFSLFTLSLLSTAMITSCARMGSPDGGWYDETPPRVVYATPADHETNVTSKKVSIYFNEYINVENVSENVVISPPQMEQPDIKTQGKRIVVQLKDSLKPNTTYTIDFSDAIVDNNESNPMGNYTYCFSTGNRIDTLECSGYVLNAEDLEPVKGIMVGLFDTVKTDSAKTFIRVSRTDSRGHFVIRGIAPGTYVAGAVMDMDGDFNFSQRGEVMAFSHREITPSNFLDHRQDTIWLDELHIKDIKRTPYTHFMPDDIVLRSFLHIPTERYFLKADRKEEDHITFFFTAPISTDSLEKFKDSENIGILPSLRLLNAPEGIDANGGSEAWSIAEYSEKGDTVTYWLRDTLLINQDTLSIEMTTLQTDTLGCLHITTDTLEVLPKTSFAKRMKQKNESYEEWRKDIEKKLKAREKQLARLKTEEERMEVPEVDTIMPPVRLTPKYEVAQAMSPDGTVRISFPYPMQRVDSAAIHLYVEQDSLWFRAPFVFRQSDNLPTMRKWELITDWIPGANYSFEIDTLAFEDIYGHTSEPYKTGLKVRNLEDYSSLFVNISGVEVADSAAILVQMLNNNGTATRTAKVVGGTAELYYVEPGKYYLRAIIDRNGNGKWDTGDYFTDRQPEEVYYNPELIECKAKWDVTKSWNLTAKPLYQQKPSEIKKQKGDKKKTIKNRNAERAKEKGIQPPSTYN